MQASSEATFPVCSLGWDKCTCPRRCRCRRDSWQPKATTIWAQLHLLHSPWRETVNSEVWSICPNVAICLGMRWITALLLWIDCNGWVSQLVGRMAILWSLIVDRMDTPFDYLCWRRSCFYYVTGLKRITDSFGFKCAWKSIYSPGWLVAQWSQGWNKILTQNKCLKMGRDVFMGPRVDSLRPFWIY